MGEADGSANTSACRGEMITVRNAAVVGAVLVVVLVVLAALTWGLNEQRHEHSLQERACSQRVTFCFDPSPVINTTNPLPTSTTRNEAWEKLKQEQGVQ